MSAARFAVTVLWSPPLVEIVWLSIGWPSTTNSGWLVPVSDALPRILIEALAPGSPDCVRTSTFGAVAASAETTFCGLLERRMRELSTVLITEPRRSRVDVVPAPVTRTSPSLSGFTVRTKSWTMVCPGESATGTVFAV